MSTAVTTPPPAPSDEALAHFQASLRFETDCADVHAAMTAGAPDFVLLDVRGPDLFKVAHVPGAINMPHRKLIASTLAAWPMDTIFVTYCAGPHCNGAQRGAIRLATLGRPVKIMVGGMTGWIDEGFPIETAIATIKRGDGE
ncbi:MAG: rhodanese-like domain-containing protein [Lautropia sp.]